jgi:hypothetical protein
MLAVGLVLAGILLVWSGLAWASSHPLGVWGLYGLFFAGAGLCLAGGILGLWLFLRTLPASSSGHPRPVHDPLWTAAWILSLAIVLPVLVIPCLRLAQTWLDGKQVELPAAAIVKSWPVTGAPLQAIILLGLVYLRRKWMADGPVSPYGVPEGVQGYVRPNQQSIYAAFHVPRRKWMWPVVFSLLSGVGLWLVAIFIQRITLALAPASWTNWFSTFSINLKLAGPANTESDGTYSLNHWAVILTMVILAPFAEEAFFRGFVYPAWRQRAGRSGEIWGLVGSSGLWAAYALNPLTLPSLLVAGLGLGLVARQTMGLDSAPGSLTPGGHTARDTHGVNLLPVWLAHLVMSLLFIFV